MPKKKKSGLKAKEFWDVSNWLWEGLDSDDELLIAYNRRPSQDMTSMCALCYQWFKSSDDFHSHMVTHIDTSRFHECSICKKKFLARFLRMRHESIHRYDSNHPFTAYWGSEHCDFPYDYFVKNHPMKRFKPVPYTQQYLKHLRRLEKINDAEPISCICCPQTFQDYDDLTKHYDLKHAIHQCVQCLEVLENFPQYEMHLRDKHNIDLPVNCSGGRWHILDNMSQSVDFELEQTRANVKFFHNYADPNLPPPKTYARSRSEISRKFSVEKPLMTPDIAASASSSDISNWSDKKESTALESDAVVTTEAQRDVETDYDTALASSNDSKIVLGLQDTENIDDKEFEDESDLPALLPVKDDIKLEWVNPDEEQNFPCEVCGRLFTDERMRNRHRRLHNVPGEKPFECKYCKKGFATHSNRKEHERIHTGERPYKCPVCDRRFIQISNLKKHIQTHKDLNTLKCTTCGKQFVKESSLVLHQRSHATERKFRCNICDRAYNYASLLKRHMRIHTGECPYQCPDCQMPFHELVSLHYHRKKMHTGERPHKCQLCGRGFILSSDLKKHHRVHLKEPSDKEKNSKVGSNMTPERRGLQASKLNGRSSSGSEPSQVEDEETDGDTFINSLNPEITLVVQNPDKNGETLHYEIQNVSPSSLDDGDCAFTAVEVMEGSSSKDLQILSIKEVNVEEDRKSLTNGNNSILKSTNSVLKVSAKLCDGNSEGKDDETQSNAENLRKSKSTQDFSEVSSTSAVKAPSRLTRLENNNVDSETWNDEEPLLIDPSWID